MSGFPASRPLGRGSGSGCFTESLSIEVTNRVRPMDVKASREPRTVSVANFSALKVRIFRKIVC